MCFSGKKKEMFQKDMGRFGAVDRWVRDSMVYVYTYTLGVRAAIPDKYGTGHGLRGCKVKSAKPNPGSALGGRSRIMQRTRR